MCVSFSVSLYPRPSRPLFLSPSLSPTLVTSFPPHSYSLSLFPFSPPYFFPTSPDLPISLPPCPSSPLALPSLPSFFSYFFYLFSFLFFPSSLFFSSIPSSFLSLSFLHYLPPPCPPLRSTVSPSLSPPLSVHAPYFPVSAVYPLFPFSLLSFPLVFPLLPIFHLSYLLPHDLPHPQSYAILSSSPPICFVHIREFLLIVPYALVCIETCSSLGFFFSTQRIFVRLLLLSPYLHCIFLLTVFLLLSSLLLLPLLPLSLLLLLTSAYAPPICLRLSSLTLPLSA